MKIDAQEIKGVVGFRQFIDIAPQDIHIEAYFLGILGDFR